MYVMTWRALSIRYVFEQFKSLVPCVKWHPMTWRALSISPYPVLGFHTMTVLSLDAEARRVPSGLHVHTHTMSSCPCSVATSRHELASHTRT